MSQEADTGLEVRGANKSFTGVRVVKDVDVTISRGSVTALIGENGAGKSTLLKIMAGVHRADAVEMRLDGAKIDIHDVQGAQRLGIAIVHQELNLMENQSVAQNIFMGRAFTRGPEWAGIVDSRRVEQQAAKMLARVGSPVSPNEIVGNLSIAQQQQVEIAKALSQADISILLLDEPTSSLPEEQAQELLQLLRGLKEKGLAIAITTHRLDEAFSVADRFVVMRDGSKVGEYDTVRDGVTKEQIIKAMVGRDLSTMFPRRRAPSQIPVLEVDHLSGGIVKDVSLTVNKGEIFGLGGLVGAGRTETARYLFGADTPSSGTVKVNGEQVTMRTPRRAVEQGFGLVPEDRKGQGLVQIQDVGRNIALPNLPLWQRGGLIDHRVAAKKVLQSIHDLAIRTRGPRQVVAQLSGGNQQKVVLAKWLARQVDILILDEPPRGVDIGARADIYRQIDDIAASGVGILLISSDMEELIGLSDRVGVMAEGRYMGTLSREEVSQETIMHMASNVVSLGEDHTLEQDRVND